MAYNWRDGVPQKASFRPSRDAESCRGEEAQLRSVSEVLQGIKRCRKPSCREWGWEGHSARHQNEDSLIFHHTTTIMQESASEFLQEQTFPTVQPIPKFHKKKQKNPIGTCLILAALLPVTAHSERPKALQPCPLAPTLPPSPKSPPGDSLEQRWTKGEQLAFSRMTLLF